jgi:hypothetical protein
VKGDAIENKRLQDKKGRYIDRWWWSLFFSNTGSATFEGCWITLDMKVVWRDRTLRRIRLTIHSSDEPAPPFVIHRARKKKNKQIGKKVTQKTPTVLGEQKG